MLGLYPNNIQRHLHIIRGIRNKFAHKMEVSTFASQRGECEKLKFQPGFSKRINDLLNQAEKPPGSPTVKFKHFKPTNNPRTQFIGAVKAITFALALAIILKGKDERS